MDYIADILIALAAGLFGGVLAGYIPRFHVRFGLLDLEPLEEHEHQYTTMRGDGQGWRCGTCDKPKGSE